MELSGAMTNPYAEGSASLSMFFSVWRSMRLHEMEIVGVDRDYVLMLAKGKQTFLLWSMEVRRELVVVSRRRRRGVGICLS